MLCAAGTALFAQAFLRLRRRGRPDHAGWSRVALWAVGMSLVCWSLLGLDSRADSNLAWHMTQHVVVGDLAAALLVLATRGPLALFLLPPAILKPVARTPLRRLARPAVAFALWAANLAVWHIPSVYDLALRHQLLHDFEHACWAVTGLLAWTILLDDRRSAGRRVALAAAMFASGQVLTDVLLFTFHPLYPAYPSVRQQQLAGIVMMAEQVVTLGTLAFVLLRPRFTRVRAVPA